MGLMARYESPMLRLSRLSRALEERATFNQNLMARSRNLKRNIEPTPFKAPFRPSSKGTGLTGRLLRGAGDVASIVPKLPIVTPLAGTSGKLSGSGTAGERAEANMTPTVPTSAQEWLERQGAVGQAVNRTIVPATAPAALTAAAFAPGAILGGTAASFGGSILGAEAERLGAPTDILGTGIGTRSAAEIGGAVLGGGLETRAGRAALQRGRANVPDAVAALKETPELGGTRLPDVAEDLPTSVGFDDTPLDPLADVRARLTAGIRDQRIKIAENKAVRSGERGSRLAASERIYQDAIAEGKPRDEAFRLKRAAQSGELTAPEAMVSNLTTDDFNLLHETVETTDFGTGLGPSFSRDNARGALFKLATGERLREHELVLMEKVIGKEAVDEIRDGLRKGLSWADIYDVVVLPKAVISAFDLSYPFRQGAMLAPAHVPEFTQSFAPMIRAFGRESTSRQVWRDIVEDVTPITLEDGTQMTFGEFATQTKLIRDLTPGGAGQGEEVFQSQLAERLPGLGKVVRASNRAFTTFGNKFRADVARTIVKNWDRDGVPLTLERLQNLSNMLNRFSGRGTLRLPGTDESTRVAKLLEALWWAPRYRVSGPQAVAQAFNFGDRAVQKEATRNLVSYVGAGLSILGMASLAGNEVGLNPLSSDFGKIGVGKTRVNIWGTNQLLARSIAQIIAGQRFDPEVGAVPTSRTNVAERYFQSGLAPEWSAMWEFAHGENYMGQPIEADKETFQREAQQRLVPLMFQDVIESVKENGPLGVAVAPLSAFGVGVQTYDKSVMGQLQEIPRWTEGNFTPRDIYDIQQLWRRADDNRAAWRREEGLEMDTEESIRATGDIMGLDPNIIDWAVTLTDDDLRTRTPQDGGLLNPEWLQFVIEHEEELREQGMNLDSNYLIDAMREAATNK